MYLRKDLISVGLYPNFRYEALELKDYFKDNSIGRGRGGESARRLGFS